MKLVTLTAALALAIAPLATAQVKAFGGAGARHSSTIFLFTEAFEVKAGLSLQHGQPVWKDAYDDQKAFDKYLDQYKGKLVRLGKDWWTTFDTSVTIDFGGTRIPAGSYFLGLSYERDGSFQLAVIDAATAMKNGEMPFAEAGWTVAYKAPLVLKKGAAAETVKEMTIDMITDKDDPTKATFQVAWGKHLLVGDMKLVLAGTADASDKKK